ncbi:MAG: adenylate/guanylate cyclase domain-containing protein [Chloroflexi bacterium]|nr:adenylate/guanylate cyclase domain-containing protein [Chloroflexota bacterium]
MPPEAGPSPSEERLLVSVLFADIVGFSSLADQLDPKQVSQVTGELWLEFDQIIKEYGGVIDKQLGDTLMVTWGRLNLRRMTPNGQYPQAFPYWMD